MTGNPPDHLHDAFAEAHPPGVAGGERRFRGEYLRSHFAASLGKQFIVHTVAPSCGGERGGRALSARDLSHSSLRAGVSRRTGRVDKRPSHVTMRSLRTETGMTISHETNNMALFCDFENVALGVRDAKYSQFDIGKVLERRC